MNTAIINERQSKYDTNWILRTFILGNKETYIKLTDELMIFLGLKNLDNIELIDNDDGSLTISKEMI
jgi:hypothetical protein